MSSRIEMPPVPPGTPLHQVRIAWCATCDDYIKGTDKAILEHRAAHRLTG